jgi:two-component system, chemotaxis family, chemotaxis protein CheY
VKHCLIVDDSSVIRKVSRRILGAMSFRVSEAEKGEKALVACRTEMPDAVLLDWNMPVMDSFEVLTQLRRMPGGAEPKIVFRTSENDIAHISRALNARANECIMKTFDKEIVTAKLQEVDLI